MKILWLSHFLPYPPHGGAKQRSYNLIKEMAKKHSIYLLAINHESFDSQLAIHDLRHLCAEVEIIDIPKYPIYKSYKALSSLLSLEPYAVSWLKNKRFKSSITGIMKRTKIDAVHFDSIDITWCIDAVKNIPKMLNHHNIESQMMYRRAIHEYNFLKKMFFFLEYFKLKNYERFICPKFKYSLTVSMLDKTRLAALCPSIKIEVIPNGVDTDYFKPTPVDPLHHSLIFAGRMGWYPNHDAMVFFFNEIWPILKKEIPDVKIFILGGDLSKFLSGICGKYPDIEITGFVEDVRPYMDKSQVYVCPIRDGGGTKLKILDALAMAKPIVAHPVAIEGIEVSPEKHLLVATTPLEFVIAIKRLFANASLRETLSAEGRKIVLEKYDFKKIGEKLSALYQNMSGNPSIL